MPGFVLRFSFSINLAAKARSLWLQLPDTIVGQHERQMRLLMIRTISLAVVIAFTATAANAGGHYTRKLCHGETWRGKTVDFVCKIDEKCYFDRIRAKGTCAKDTGRRSWGHWMFSRKR